MIIPILPSPSREAVAAGKAELGPLVCTSGVGVTITANKVAGVRAALAADEETAVIVPPAQRRQCPLLER